MSTSSNSNYVQTKDGWRKRKKSVTRGNADYFSRPTPPVRDGQTGHPIGKDGNVDWGRVIRDANNGS